MPPDVVAVPISRFRVLQPWTVVAALLLACLIKGLVTLQGVVVPPDPDTVRDLGLIQGFLDGSWTADPILAGAWRWYPPLLHALAALVAGGLRLALLPMWLQAGVWLNLLTPLSFHLMNRRLIGEWPAAAATAVLLLFDSVAMPRDVTVGYTPWTLTPALAWPLFFGSVWLIAGRLARFRLTDAVLIGSAAGLVFLAHTVPAILLSVMILVAGVAAGGVRTRTITWLAVVAVTELAWAAPFVGPLAAAYRLHIANPVPGGWVHPALSDPFTLVPNLAGVGAAAWLLVRRGWRELPVVPLALLAGWIGGCAVPLGRHFACSAMGETGGACGVFVVAAHHYHVYLQAAWASVGGLALVRLWQRELAPLLLLAGLAGLVGLFVKPEDAELRRLGSTQPQLIMDRAAYDWILVGTAAQDLFVTDLPADAVDMGPAAATVMAAGRRLVAPPRYHTNPYVEWEALNARREAYLAAGGDLCPFWRQARAGGGTAFLLLANGRPAGQAKAVFRSAYNSIYRVEATACGSGEGGEDFLQRRELVSGGG